MLAGVPLFWSCLGIIMDLAKRTMFQYLVVVCFHVRTLINRCLAAYLIYSRFCYGSDYIHGLVHYIVSHNTPWNDSAMVLWSCTCLNSLRYICLCIHEPIDCWSYYYMMLLSWIVITPMRAMLLVLIAWCWLLHCPASILATVAVEPCHMYAYAPCGYYHS